MHASIIAAQTRLEAEAASIDASKAGRHARSATRDLERIEALSKANPTETAISDIVGPAGQACAAIQRVHRRAVERERYDELTSGLKVRAWRMGRSVAVPGLLRGLAGAARKMESADAAGLPEGVRCAAEVAAGMVALIGVSQEPIHPAKLLGGQTVDWGRTAGQLEAWSAREPPELSFVLGLGFFFIGRDSLAFAEIERADPAKLASLEERNIARLVRALVLNRLGLPAMAAEEAESLSGDGANGPECLATVHLVLAYVHAEQREWRLMDNDLAAAVRVVPNHPLVVFLSGERILADGRKEQALETFTATTSGTEMEWLGPLVEKRVRQVRDAEGPVPPLLLDPAFSARVGVGLLMDQTKRSESGRKIGEWLAAARSLMPFVESRSDGGT